MREAITLSDGPPVPLPRGPNVRRPPGLDADFAGRVRGRCMEPDYPDGCTVAFRLVPADAQALLSGPHFVQLANGECMLKLVTGAPGENVEDLFFLSCLNAAEFSFELMVPASKVVRLARAIAVLRPPGQA